MLFCFLFFLWENERRKTKKNEGKESSGHAPWKRFHSSFIFQRFIHPFFLVSIALNVGHTHTQIRRKSRTGHIYTISFCLDWLVPLQSTHWSNSLVDAWSLDPTLQWPLFILLFFSFHAVVVICIIELRRTDGRVIRNETTCNYRRDWRSYPYFFLFLLFIFQEKKREDRQWRPRRRRVPLPRSGSPTSCTRPAPLYGRNKSTTRVATRANRPAKHRYSYDRLHTNNK